MIIGPNSIYCKVLMREYRLNAKSDKFPKRDRLLWERTLIQPSRQAIFWAAVSFLEN